MSNFSVYDYIITLLLPFSSILFLACKYCDVGILLMAIIPWIFSWEIVFLLLPSGVNMINIDVGSGDVNIVLPGLDCFPAYV